MTVGYHHRPLSDVETSRIIRLIRAGELSLHQIAKMLGRSLYLIRKIQAKLAALDEVPRL